MKIVRLLPRSHAVSAGKSYNGLTPSMISRNSSLTGMTDLISYLMLVPSSQNTKPGIWVGMRASLPTGKTALSFASHVLMQQMSVTLSTITMNVHKASGWKV